MAVNGNKKGSRGERDFVAHLGENGMGEWRRSQQYKGAQVEGAGDVIPEEGNELAESLGAHVRFEVKRYKDRVETYSKQMTDWLEQARDETPEGKLAVIAIRENRGQWDLVLNAGGMIVRTEATAGNLKRLRTLLSSAPRIVHGQLTLTELLNEKTQEGPTESDGVRSTSEVLHETSDRLRRLAERAEEED